MVDLLLRLFVKDYRDVKNEKVREKYGLFASFFGLISNFLLFALKIVIGILLRLYSIVSDSINNLSDFGNNLLSLFGVKVSAKKADDDHPYGHQRMEYIISLVIGCVIIALGAIMVYQSVIDFIAFVKSMIETGHPLTKEMSPLMFYVSLALLLGAILVKFLQSYLYFSLGKRIDSMQLRALGKDARNDVISTSLVIIGMVISFLTTYDIDCFFTMIVAGLVILSGIGIMREAIDVLLGKKPDDEIVDRIVDLVTSHKDVLGVHDLSLHYYGQVIYGVIHVEVDCKRDVMLSHELCDDIEREADEKLSVHLTVHMDPIDIHDPDTEKYKELVKKALSQKEAYQSISMHDFRILSNEKFVNLIFDLVIPENLDTEEGREQIKQDILKVTDMSYGKNTYLVIDFDSQTTDFLKKKHIEK